MHYGWVAILAVQGDWHLGYGWGLLRAGHRRAQQLGSGDLSVTARPQSRSRACAKGGVTCGWVAALTLVAVALLGGGCSLAASGTAEPSAAVDPIVLRAAPPNLGCDSILPLYRSATIRIDRSQEEQVWAEADTGERLDVFWSVGFVGGSSAEPVVSDPAGKVVARDGERIILPEADWPRLQGYFVCPGTTALYVLLRDPE